MADLTAVCKMVENAEGFGVKSCVLCVQLHYRKHASQVRCDKHPKVKQNTAKNQMSKNWERRANEIAVSCPDYEEDSK